MTQALLPVVQQQIRYHAWATREMWLGIVQLPEAELSVTRGTSFDTMLATLTHMYMADRVWWNRLSGTGPALLTAIETPAPGMLEAVWHKTLQELGTWTDALTDEGLAGSIQYANSGGSSFDTPVWQVLLHVVNHGSGHRGQVNGMMRQAGSRPFNTDSIQFYRSAGAGPSPG